MTHTDTLSLDFITKYEITIAFQLTFEFLNTIAPNPTLQSAIPHEAEHTFSRLNPYLGNLSHHI